MEIGLGKKNKVNIEGEQAIYKMDLKAQKFAFDVEGTLVDKKLNLQNGVLKLFNNILLNNPNAEIIFISGRNTDTLEKVVRKINAGLSELGNGCILNPKIAGFVGSKVLDENKNVIFEETLKPETIMDFLGRAGRYSDTFPFFLGKNGQYCNVEKLTPKQKVILEVYSVKEKSNGEGAFIIDRVNSEKMNEIINAGEIYSIETICLNNKDRALLEKDVQKMCEDGKLFASVGRALQVSSSSKLNTLQKVYGDDLSGVAYFGDGNNDKKCMKACGYSFGVGTNLSVLEASKVALNNIFDGFKCLSTDERWVKIVEEKSKDVIKKAKQAEQMKKEKNENSLKNKIKKLSKQEEQEKQA